MSNFILLQTTPSTMEAARDKLGIEDVIIISPHQTAGRGRQGRLWETAPGNLAMTIATPLLDQPFDPRIAFVVGLAVCQAIQNVLPEKVRIKWPNDILVNQKKISGILIEKYQSHLLIGIGVNIVSHPSHLPATHLQAYKREVSYDELARLIYKNFVFFQTILKDLDFDRIRHLWLEKALFLGEKIEIHHPDNAQNKISGIFRDIDLDGALVLECSFNKTVRIHVGEIFPTD